MTTITTFDPKVFAKEIFPRLNTQDTITFNRVSKTAQEFLERVANVSHDDLNFAAEKVTCIPQTIPALLRQKWKMEIFTRRPELLPGKPRGNGWWETQSMHALVPCDFQEGKLQAPDLLDGLGRGASWSRDQELLKTALFHPNIAELSAYNFYYNANDTLLDNDHKKFRMIVLHPAAAEIPAEGDFGLEALLWHAVSKDHGEEMVKAIFSHPNAGNIRADCHGGLATSLEIAMQKSNSAIAKLIYAHPNAKDIPANGNYSIGRLLSMALSTVHGKVPVLEEIEWLLSFPNAKDIDAVEEHYRLGWILRDAVRTKNLGIVKAILSHPNAVKIPTANWGGSFEDSFMEWQKTPEIIVAIVPYTKFERWSPEMLTIGLWAAAKTNSFDLLKRILRHIKVFGDEQAMSEAYKIVEKYNREILMKIFTEDLR